MCKSIRGGQKQPLLISEGCARQPDGSGLLANTPRNLLIILEQEEAFETLIRKEKELEEAKLAAKEAQRKEHLRDKNCSRKLTCGRSRTPWLYESRIADLNEALASKTLDSRRKRSRASPVTTRRTGTSVLRRQREGLCGRVMVYWSLCFSGYPITVCLKQ
jgi:chromatin segregation and condensation protein Rec8/ScpA/Scc1 (kleisin family)